MAFSEFSRRELLQAAAAAGVSSVVALAQEQQRAASEAPATAPAGPVFYYVDGYHGGVDGHMPPDSLRNVLDGLEKFPHWKVSFEIEPYSWAVFAKSDPASIERLRRFLSDATPSGRIELVSGAYGQAYMWNASGESNIRQIEFGLAELRAAFPGIVVDTYAVQEPCWTSCLPHILKSFGYRRAVLKNSTCWGGYHAQTLDADVMHWVAPEGTGITTAPRYAFEQLVAPATEAAAQPTEAFIEHCRAIGIEHPAGTILQDMGWPGRPWRLGMKQEVVSGMRHVTWREYVDTIGSPPSKSWNASQEDLRVGLPWGGSILQRIAQVVRLSENQLVQTEKMASMAFVRRGTPFPKDALREAWKLLLWSQHHDVWIVSYNRHRDGTWASAVDAKRESIHATCRQIVDAACVSMTVRPADDAKTGRFVRVFNTTGFRRHDLAAVDVTGGSRVRVLDARGQEVVCQIVAGSGGAPESASLLFAADVPSMGYATYEIAAADAAPARMQTAVTRASSKPDGTVVLETDLYAISIDPAKGGRISSLFAKELAKEFVNESSPRGFNEMRGYYPNESKWLTSVDAPAQIQVLEEGPLRATAIIRGRIGPWPFVTRVSAAAGQRRIDFQTSFEFPPDAPPFGGGRRAGAANQPNQRFRLGEPWDGRDTVRSNRRPFYDSSFKLQALFPAKLQRPTLDKNAPFDVCRSTMADTRFNAWDAIKNNIIFNWVDLLDHDGAAGLALMTDHLTAYSLTPDEPLGLVLCYAGRGIWHDYGLGRAPSVSYSIVPHAGDWARAQLWRELARWSDPLLTARHAQRPEGEQGWSLLDGSEGGLEVTTLFADGDDILIRLFNAEGDSGPKQLTLDGRVRRAWLMELDGRRTQELPVQRAADGTSSVTVTVRRLAVRTLRCELA